MGLTNIVFFSWEEGLDLVGKFCHGIGSGTQLVPYISVGNQSSPNNSPPYTINKWAVVRNNYTMKNESHSFNIGFYLASQDGLNTYLPLEAGQVFEGVTYENRMYYCKVTFKNLIEYVSFRLRGCAMKR